MLLLARQERTKIEEHCVESFPEECCGLLIGRENDHRVVTEARRAANVQGEMRERRYLIDPMELVRTERMLSGSGRMILGFYHSHPNATAIPSEFDRNHAWPWYDYLIVSVHGVTVMERRVWRLSEDRSTFAEQQLEIT